MRSEWTEPFGASGSTSPKNHDDLVVGVSREYGLLEEEMKAAEALLSQLQSSLHHVLRPENPHGQEVTGRNIDRESESPLASGLHRQAMSLQAICLRLRDTIDRLDV